MAASTDWQSVCSLLDQFCLPAALGRLDNDAFVSWNASFREETGLSDLELKDVKLSQLIVLEDEEDNPERECDASPTAVNFIPCVLKRMDSEHKVTGRVLKREDGYFLVMLNEPFAEPGTGEFARGRLLGQREERERLWELLHNSLNPHLIVAVFAAQSAKEKLESKGLAEAADLSKVTKILDHVIEQTVTALEMPSVEPGAKDSAI
ncbi:MAG: hypothetical protein WB586_15630 [Chthoniobacterales bacterium]